MRQNIGKTERVIRVVVGLGILSLAFFGPASPWGYLGLAPVVTGLAGWCPPYTLLGIDTRSAKEKAEQSRVTAMQPSTVFADASMLLLSILIGVGSVVMFVLLQSVHYLPMGWPDRYVLLWDALLSLAFFVQHSVMVRRPVRARLAAIIPARYQGALYSIASGVVLALVVILWQTSETRVFVLDGLPRRIAQALSILAVAAFALSAVTLRRSFDPLGLGPIRAHLRGRADVADDFVVRGSYLWVRHPLYSCILVLFWTNPDVTVDQLLLNVLWSIWIWIGAMLEERDLVADFGEAYRAYQRQVPMLIPWRGRVTLTGGQAARTPVSSAGGALV